MYEAFVEDTQHDVDRDDRRQNKPGLPGQGAREFIGIAGVVAHNRGWHADVLLRLADHAYGVAKRSAVCKIEADGHRWELVLVKNGERRRPALDVGNGVQWHLRAGNAGHV